MAGQARKLKFILMRELIPFPKSLRGVMFKQIMVILWLLVIKIILRITDKIISRLLRATNPNVFMLRKEGKMIVLIVQKHTIPGE